MLDGNVETMLLAILEENPRYGYETVRLLNERAACFRWAKARRTPCCIGWKSKS